MGARATPVIKGKQTKYDRVSLYRLFTDIIESSPPDETALPKLDSKAPEKILNAIPLRLREAFLLMALEGFSETDASRILKIGIPDLRKLVTEAGRFLARHKSADVLIIEDEAFIAMDLEGMVESLGHRVLGVARTHSEAIALAHAKRPGLILADIQLADGTSGLDAVNEILKSRQVPVIFITA